MFVLLFGLLFEVGCVLFGSMFVACLYSLGVLCEFGFYCFATWWFVLLIWVVCLVGLLGLVFSGLSCCCVCWLFDIVLVLILIYGLGFWGWYGIGLRFVVLSFAGCLSLGYLFGGLFVCGLMCVITCLHVFVPDVYWVDC